MFKYDTKELLNRALGLADLKNSDFLSYGELFHYLNDAYREVYQDSINVGEQNYLQVVRLEGSGSRVYDLPNDLYQIVSITNENGVALNRKDPRESEESSGYAIINNQLFISKTYGSVILKYYPTPETITTKAKEIEIELPIEPIDGYNSKVIDSNGNIYDLQLNEFIRQEAEETLYSKVLMGKYSFIADGVEYSFNGEKLGEGNYLLNENGTFVKKSDDFDYAVSNEDESETFIIKDNKVYYQTIDNPIAEFDNIKSARYYYFDGKPAVVINSNSKILTIFNDGSYFTNDSNGILLKTDLETGYGILTKKGGNYFIEGYLPNTLIDYPNNLFFSLVAYKLAIAFRIKQNADYSLLKASYDSLYKTYTSSISVNGSDYPTIRNVYNECSWY